MTNINEINPKSVLINEFTMFENGSTVFGVSYCWENNTLHIVLNDIECIFRKSGMHSYLVFCETDRNKRLLDKYIRVINKIKEEILFIVEDGLLVFQSE